MADDPGPFTLISLMGAVLSDDRAHRYWLWRIWTRSLPILVVCMFNPSTADARDDDPTIGRLCAFAQRWGYGGILVINLRSYRTADPDECKAMGKASCGDAQHDAWAHALDIAARQGTPILVAWGNLASADDAVPLYAAAPDIDLICLGLNGNGSPKHPMARGRNRVPDDQQPVEFRRAA